MSRYDAEFEIAELEVMAEGLHPRDIIWLEQRVAALEKTLEEIADSPSARPSSKRRAIEALAGDASGG